MNRSPVRLSALPHAVHIYGAGESGRHARRLLRAAWGVEAEGFVDSFRDGEFDGLPVRRADRFAAEEGTNAVVVIASQFRREIEATLAKLGLSAAASLSGASLSWRDYVDFRTWTDPILGISSFADVYGEVAAPPSEPPPPPLAAPSPAPVADIPLEVSFHTDYLVDLPLTDRCDLRCVYCPHHTIPASEWRDTPEWMRDGLLRLLASHPGARIELGGGQGETTILPDWRERCLPLIELGHRLRITTNLAHPLSWEEADTLSRFDRLSFSLDSLDKSVLRRLRVGASPTTIIANLALIRSAAVARNEQGPDFTLHAVVTDQNATNLDRLVDLARANGVGGVRLIAINTGRPPADGVGLADELDRGTLARVLGDIRRAYEKAIVGDVHLIVDPDLVARLKRGVEVAETNGEAIIVAPPEMEAPTRECFEPWEHLVTFSNGDAAACCYSAGRFLLEGEWGHIDDVLNAPPLRELRRRLLSGDLDGACLTCVAKRMVPVAEFRARLATNRSIRPPRSR